MKMNYNTIKSNYDKYGEEILNIMYYHYYYIVLNVYQNNNQEIEKRLIEEKLKEILSSYIEEGEKYYNPSKYIHEKMYKFVNDYKFLKLKEEQNKLINSAYSGDMNARKKIFLLNAYRIDNKALEIYNKYTNDEGFILNFNDIKSIMYCDMFRFTNRFYDRENKGFYYSTYFDTHLRDLTIRIEKHINKKNYLLLKQLKDYFVESFILEESNSDYSKKIK